MFVSLRSKVYTSKAEIRAWLSRECVPCGMQDAHHDARLAKAEEARRKMRAWRRRAQRLADARWQREFSLYGGPEPVLHHVPSLSRDRDSLWCPTCGQSSAGGQCERCHELERGLL